MANQTSLLQVQIPSKTKPQIKTKNVFSSKIFCHRWKKRKTGKKMRRRGSVKRKIVKSLESKRKEKRQKPSLSKKKCKKTRKVKLSRKPISNWLKSKRKRKNYQRHLRKSSQNQENQWRLIKYWTATIFRAPRASHPKLKCLKKKQGLKLLSNCQAKCLLLTLIFMFNRP